MNYQILSKEKVYQERFLLEKAWLRVDTFKSGTMDIERYELVRPNVVAALVYVEDVNKLALVKQFRYSSRDVTDGWMLEIVAGLIEKGEDVESAARREILEESGYEVKGLEKTMVVYTSPGFSNQLTHIFLAKTSSKLKKNEGVGLADEGEDIQTKLFSIEEAKALVQNGRMYDAITIIALQNFLARF